MEYEMNISNMKSEIQLPLEFKFNIQPYKMAA